MDASPNPAWLHGLWAAVVALFWRLWATQSDKIEKLETKVDKLSLDGAASQVLQANLSGAIVKLETAIKENVEESRKQSEALVRIETILQAAIIKEK
jgi:hypothetical protein